MELRKMFAISLLSLLMCILKSPMTRTCLSDAKMSVNQAQFVYKNAICNLISDGVRWKVYCYDLQTLFLQDMLYFTYWKEVLAPSSSNLIKKSLCTTSLRPPPGQSLQFDVKRLYSLIQRSKHCMQTASASSSLSQVSVMTLISHFTKCR